MLGIISRSFIEKVHDAFDEIEYHTNTMPNFNEFKEKIVYSITHAKDLEDAINATRMFQFCVNEWDKIQKIFSNHLSTWKEYRWEGSALLNYCSDDEAIGNYYFTNAISSNYKTIYCLSVSLENEIFEFDYSHGCFKIDDDSKYYIKYSKMSSTKMKLFDDSDECIANIVLSDNCEVFLDKNETPFQIVLQDGYIEIYRKEYYDDLDDDDYIDQEQMVASIEWDILEKKSSFGVSLLTVYEDCSDEEFEILFLIAASTFLLFKSYISAVNATNLALIASANYWHRRR